MRSSWPKSPPIFLVVAAVGCGVLLLARIAHVISFHRPLQIVTSGGEEEVLFSIWTFTQGLPVYMHPLSIPFSQSYYNWLFYAVYGSVAKGGLDYLHLSAAWLPTLCRLLTLGIGLVGCALFAVTLRLSNLLPDTKGLLLLTFAVLATINPLYGLWLLSARPDVLAITCELAAVALFFRYLRSGNSGWIMLVACALYFAWACKQISVSALIGLAITLGVMRRPRALWLLLGLWSTAVFITLAVGTEEYRHSLYLSQIHGHLDLGSGLHYLGLALSKMPFLLLVPLSFIYLLGVRQRIDPWHPPELAAFSMMVAAFLTEFPPGCKIGAADYYYIPLAVWGMLWLILISRRLPPLGWDRGMMAASCLMIVGVASIFQGWRGTLGDRDSDSRFHELAQRLAPLPGPVFVEEAYGNLPWIQRQPPYFVLAFHYDDDRAAGIQHDGGGWQGLMDHGYFSTVVLKAGSKLRPAAAGHYRLVGGDDFFLYFARK